MIWADAKCQLLARLSRKRNLFVFKYAANSQFLNCYLFWTCLLRRLFRPFADCSSELKNNAVADLGYRLQQLPVCGNAVADSTTLKGRCRLAVGH